MAAKQLRLPALVKLDTLSPRPPPLPLPLRPHSVPTSRPFFPAFSLPSRIPLSNLPLQPHQPLLNSNLTLHKLHSYSPNRADRLLLGILLIQLEPRRVFVFALKDKILMGLRFPLLEDGFLVLGWWSSSVCFCGCWSSFVAEVESDCVFSWLTVLVEE